jgi:hypothetical protein
MTAAAAATIAKASQICQDERRKPNKSKAKVGPTSILLSAALGPGIILPAGVRRNSALQMNEPT